MSVLVLVVVLLLVPLTGTPGITRIYSIFCMLNIYYAGCPCTHPLSWSAGSVSVLVGLGLF
jgi:hypothetical protein